MCAEFLDKIKNKTTFLKRKSQWEVCLKQNMKMKVNMFKMNIKYILPLKKKLFTC